MLAVYNQVISVFPKVEASLGAEPTATLWMFLSGTFYFIMLMYTKLVAGAINTVQISVYRGVLLFLLFYVVTIINKIPRNIDDRSLYKKLLLRNFLGCLHNFFQFIAVRYIRVSVLTTINMTGPIVICFLDAVIYKTVYTAKDKLLTVINIFGVMMVANPKIFTSLFSMAPSQDPAADSNYDSNLEFIMICVQLVLLCIWGYSMILIRELKSLNTVIVGLPFGIILAFLSSSFLLYDGNVTEISWSDGINIIFFVGLAAFLCQIASMRAMQIQKTGKATIFLNIPVFWGFLFEIIFLKETPNPISLLGSVIVAVTSVMLTLSKAKK